MLAVKIAERFGLLVERQWSAREEGRLARRLKAAQLKLTASVEETDFRTPRGLDRGVFLDLAELGFLRHAGNVILTGATGLGKTYLACALADRAARRGHSDGALGDLCCLSFRPVSTALADQPATTRREPITATVHAAHESMIQAHTTSVTRARRLPGSSG